MAPRASRGNPQPTKRTTSRRIAGTASDTAVPPGAKAWAGRFSEATDRLVETFSSSVAFDRRLYPYDIQGSIAHCKTMERAGIFTTHETNALIKGLRAVNVELDEGRFTFAKEDEDIHMAIERRVTELIGPVGGKLHTGRSRNDQVALDIRLFLRDVLGRLEHTLAEFQSVLVAQARGHIDVVMPGYTHLQRAQPVLLAHYLLAYVEMFGRDRERLRDARSRLNVMPLGSGALAGTNYPVDRRYTARLLDFPTITQNSLDAVSDRDFVVESLAAFSLIMTHLSRMSEELILWASQEFQFVDLPEAYCTGSSMMPQKKNPDVPELVRGKTGRVYGHLVSVLAVLKALPLSYNRDLQEDKEALFDAVDTTLDSASLLKELIRKIRFNRDAMAKAVADGGMLATELADYLVMKGVPFREAHATAGRVVRACLSRHIELHQLTAEELHEFSDRFEDDVLGRLTVEASIEHKAQVGGTAKRRVEAKIREWERILP